MRQPLVRVPSHADLANLVPGKIAKVRGIVNIDTHIAFRSYSRADTEAVFSIGAESGG